MPTTNKKYFAFIDAENIRNALEELGYKDFDYIKLYDWLKKQDVSRAFIYTGIEKNDSEKSKMYEDLKKVGYMTSVKEVMEYKRKAWELEITCPKCKNKFKRKIYSKNKKKANCDAEMTLDIIRLGVRKKYKGIIVFSGDGDFASVYNYVAKQINKEVIVYAPLGKIRYRTSKMVKELAENKIISLKPINDLLIFAQKN